MKFKEKINTATLISFFTLVVITGIQYTLLFFYFIQLGFHPTFIQSGIQISIIFLLTDIYTRLSQSSNNIKGTIKIEKKATDTYTGIL